MLKIALFGKMRSGKDTVGRILIEDYNFNAMAFGRAIGDIIETYFPDILEMGKPRKHYQVIGQSFRELDEDVWINYLLSDLETYINKCRFLRMSPTNMVITDGRQPNEAKRLKEEGFIIVKVTTRDDIRLERIKKAGDVFSEQDLNHETELSVDLINPDFEIFNNGTLDDLKERVKTLLEELHTYEQ